jgi:hypothetical protein
MPYGARSKAQKAGAEAPEKSFIKELTEFYTEAWRSCKCLSVDESWESRGIWGGIMQAARKAGGLAPEYAERLVADGAPLRVDVKRGDPRNYRQYRQSVWSKNGQDDVAIVTIEIIGELTLDVVGFANVPSGAGVWLYAYSPVYERFLVLRIEPSDPQAAISRCHFKKVAVSTKRGSLSFVPSLNKVYRFSAELEASIKGDIDGLPFVSPDDLLLIRRGLIPPRLVVEAPIPKADGSVAPGVGVIAAVDSNGPTPLGGCMYSLPAGSESLTLDASYAPLDRRGGYCPIVLLFLSREWSYAHGYYFGSLGRRACKGEVKYYVPSRLFIKALGRDIAHFIRAVPDSLLEYYERPVGGDLIECPVLPMRGKLQRAYLRRASEEFKVPNPQLIGYREAGTWLRYVTERGAQS